MADNPGSNMAAMVDSEIARFRELQQSMQKLRSDLQTLLSQHNENEMVKQELDLLDDSANVYKMVGPVLLKNDLDDAKQTVEKRLEFISGDIKKIELSLEEKEKKANESAKKVQEMQSAMQQAAAEAARQIAQQNAQS